MNIYRAKTILRLCFAQRGFLRIRYRNVKGGKSPAIELRVNATDIDERREIQSALKALGVRFGRPFRKSKKSRGWVVPLYGRKNCLHFLDVVSPKGGSEMRRRVNEARPLVKNRGR